MTEAARGRAVRVVLARERAARIYEEIARFYLHAGDLKRAGHFVRCARRYASPRSGPQQEVTPASAPPANEAVKYLIEDDGGCVLAEFTDPRQAKRALRALAMAGPGSESGLLLWSLDRDDKAVRLPCAPGDID